jgi:hypothetical protein
MAQLHQAYLLHRDATFQAAELEARLLAAESTEQIVARLNIPASVVDLFHDVFFDVRPMLNSESYIRSTVFPKEIHSKGIQDFHTFMKAMAFGGGPHVLEDVLWYRSTPRPDRPKNLRTASKEQLLHLQRWFTVHWLLIDKSIVPKNDRERLRLIAIHRRLAWDDYRQTL